MASQRHAERPLKDSGWPRPEIRFKAIRFRARESWGRRSRFCEISMAPIGAKGTDMDGRASLSIAAGNPDLDMIAARSAGIWIGLSIDDDALSAIRRDGLDPAALRLTGLHPFEYERADDGALAVTAHANDNEAAEALLDLFRVYFLRRLLG